MGGGGGWMRRCFRPRVGVRISMFGTEGAGVLGRRGVPSIGRPCGLVSMVRLPPVLPCAPAFAAGGGGVFGQLWWFLVKHFQWGGSSSSGAVGPADTCPLGKVDRRRPSSARVSAFSLPRIAMWEAA